MEYSEDLIVDISPSLEKFFRTAGKMLKPSRQSVRGLIAQIPAGQLSTPDRIRKHLAARFNVQVTCPYDTRMVLEAIAHDPQEHLPYWRVVKTNGELMPRFPGGLEGHAAKLAAEGFEIDRSGKKPKVRHFRQSLAVFA